MVLLQYTHAFTPWNKEANDINLFPPLKAFMWPNILVYQLPHNYTEKSIEICLFELSKWFASWGPINNIPAFQPSWPQTIIWTNDGSFIDATMRHSASLSYNAIALMTWLITVLFVICYY